MRSESTISVFSYLAGDPSAILLRRVATNGLSEYSYSKVLSRYAYYLDDRILSFRELGYDIVYAGKRDRFARLRKLSVSRGLFKEISMIQRVMSSLLKCSFFSEDLRDEVSEAALQMTLKDLLAYYMAMNEGIINMLEHYFEMSKADAERSLELYRRFCFQTENVLAFLNAAKRYSYQLRSVIPNLKHAPLSLATALEEYLHETDFSKHEAGSRSKASTAEGVKESKTDASSEEPNSTTDKPATEKSSPQKASTMAGMNQTSSSSKKALQDFFESLEQPSTPFNSAYASYTGFYTQPDWFGMSAMPTNGVYGMPQVSGNPFGVTPKGSLQPQMTGFNPFSPQMPIIPQQQQPLIPQHTVATTPFDSIFGQMSLNSAQRPQQPHQMQFNPQSIPQQPQPSSQAQSQLMAPSVQQSSMLTQPHAQEQSSLSFSEPAKPVKPSSSNQGVRPQKTGSMNPFSIPSDFDEPNPVVQEPPKPTLNELAMDAWLGKEKKSDHAPALPSVQPNQTGIFGHVASEFARPQLAQPKQDSFSKSPDHMLGEGISMSPQIASRMPSHSMGSQVFGDQHTPLYGQSTGQTIQTQPFGRPSLTATPNTLVSSTSSEAPNRRLSALVPPQQGLGISSQRTGLDAFGVGGTPSQSLSPQFSGSAFGTSPISLGTGSVLYPRNSVSGSQAMTSSSGIGSQPSRPSGHLTTFERKPSVPHVSAMSHSDLQSQITGLTGIKPFQPSSAFGASLVSGQLAPKQTSNTTTPTPVEAQQQLQPTQDLLQL